MDRYLNLPNVIFLSYLTKMIYFGPTIYDSVVVFALSALVGLQMYNEKKQNIQQIREECNKNIEEIKIVVNKQNETILAQAVEFGKLRNDFQGIRLKNDFSKVEEMKGFRKLG